MAIDYQAIAKAGGIGKGPSKKSVKAKKDREDAKRLAEFRSDVWAREESRVFDYEVLYPDAYNVAACQNCGATVVRGPDVIMTGEVHHRIFRGNKATRYLPENGVLLCNWLVNDCHRKVQEGLIKV